MMKERVRNCEDRVLCTRIVGEYLEMPGLNLTLSQACRLWNLERPQCTHMLDTLLASGFLRKSGETYLRADSQRAA